VNTRLVSDAFLRTPFPEAQQHQLRGSTTLHVGLGSIGSAIANSLVRAGVGGGIYADVDSVGIENLYRHEACLLDVGRRKAHSERDRSLSLNPGFRVEAMDEDLLSWPTRELDALIGRVNLIIETTDKHSVKVGMMTAAYRNHCPILFCGAHENAKSGEILFWLGTGACYACLPREAAPPHRRTLDYTNAADPEDYAGEPGLGAAIREYAACAAQAALAILLRNAGSELSRQVLGMGARYILLGSAGCAGYHVFEHPFQNFLQPLSGINPECSVHNPEATLRLLAEG
jgi:molybdopterin/thiamine biosynthesis adenylyltransferase